MWRYITPKYKHCTSVLTLLRMSRMVQWAPIKIPIKRRFQTLAVMFQVYMFLFGHILGTCLLLALLVLHTYTAIIAVLYSGWAFILDSRTPSRGGRYFQFIRRWKIWKYYCEYFPIRLVKTADLDAKDNYIFGYHPHGIIGMGAIGNFCGEETGFSEKFPGIYPHLLTLSVNFKFPFTRDYCMAMGACSVDKGSIEYILREMGPGHSAAIVIGGAAESLEARPGNFKLTLKDRKGFVKLALRNG